jgi:hypothetical protein
MYARSHPYGNVPLILDHTLFMKGKLVTRRVPTAAGPRSVAGPLTCEAPSAFPWNLSAGSHLQATATGTYCPISGLWSATVQGRQVIVQLLEGQMMPTASGQPVQWAFVAPANFDAMESPLGISNKESE